MMGKRTMRAAIVFILSAYCMVDNSRSAEPDVGHRGCLNTMLKNFLNSVESAVPPMVVCTIMYYVLLVR